MTISLDLPAEISEQVRAEARRRSVTEEKLLVEIVSRSFVQTEDVARRLHILDSLDEIGTDEEQRETFEQLKDLIDADRLSDRKRFP